MTRIQSTILAFVSVLYILKTGSITAFRANRAPTTDTVAVVTAYGAVPNDTTDDAAPIQHLLDHTPAGVRQIRVPPGSYILSQSIMFRNDHIVIDLDSAILKLSARASIVVNGNAISIRGHGTSVIDGTRTSNKTIIQLGGAGDEIVGIAILGSTHGATEYSGVTVTGASANLDSLHISDVTGIGIVLQAPNIRVRHSTIENTGLSGVFFASRASGSFAGNNHIVGANYKAEDGQGGIVVQGDPVHGENAITITGNLISQSASSGITINSGESQSGARLTKNVLISSDTVEEMNHAPQAGEGITFTADSVCVVHNVVSASQAWGINAYRETHGSTIAFNKLFNIGVNVRSANAPFAAIRLVADGPLFHISDVTITNNVVQDTQSKRTTLVAIELQSKNRGVVDMSSITTSGNTSTGTMKPQPILQRTSGKADLWFPEQRLAEHAVTGSTDSTFMTVPCLVRLQRDSPRPPS